MTKDLTLKCITTLAFFLVSSFATLSYAQTSVTLKGGTPIMLETTTELASNKCIPGQIVDLRVSSSIIVDGECVIPAGTIAKGQVSNATKSSVLGKNGTLSVNIISVNAIDGTMVPLSGGNLSNFGKRRVGLAIVCGCFTLVGFLIPGSQAKIPAGSQVTAIVMSNTTITL